MSQQRRMFGGRLFAGHLFDGRIWGGRQHQIFPQKDSFPFVGPTVSRKKRRRDTDDDALLFILR